MNKKYKRSHFIVFFMILLVFSLIRYTYVYCYNLEFLIINSPDYQIEKILINGVANSDFKYLNKDVYDKENISTIISFLNSINIISCKKKNPPQNFTTPYLLLHINYEIPPNQYIILTENYVYYRYKTDKYFRYTHNMQTIITDVIDLLPKEENIK